MRPVSGPISDRLRRLLSPKDPAWNPPRGGPVKGVVPANVSGQRVGGKPGRKAAR